MRKRRKQTLGDSYGIFSRWSNFLKCRIFNVSNLIYEVKYVAIKFLLYLLLEGIEMELSCGELGKDRCAKIFSPKSGR